MRGAGQSDVDFADVRPWSGAVDVFDFILKGAGAGDFGEGFTLNFEVGHESDFFGGDAIGTGGDDGAFAVGEGDYGGAEFNGFESGVLGDVAGAGDGDFLAFEGLFAFGDVLDHVVDVLFV